MGRDGLRVYSSVRCEKGMMRKSCKNALTAGAVVEKLSKEPVCALFLVSQTPRSFHRCKSP